MTIAAKSVPAFRWCRDEADARALAKLFAANITPSYVSHSELQGARALAPGVWSPDIAQVLERELTSRVSNPLDAPAGGVTYLVAALAIEGRDVGVFLVTFSREAHAPFAILEDIVIEQSHRAKGFGAQYLDWITRECKARGIARMFLESGHDNHRAHDFFERVGFAPVSVVMMKDIE